MAFNLADYETVESRLEKWHGQFPDGRIETELVEASNTRFIVVCRLFKTEADAKPCASGIASETISDRGVNATSALENCETSAIGRALANAGFAAKGKRASREEMVKVEQFTPKYSAPGSKARAMEQALHLVDQKQTTNEPAPVEWAVGDVVASIGSNTPAQEECKHGPMILKQGTAKTGKPYYGYVCSAAKPDQCDARWAKITANGKWYFEGGE
jgi:hypothetical protein